MQLKELGEKLAYMYYNAPDKEQVTMIHLFGIKFALEIDKQGFTASEVIEASGINKSYATELSKGKKLAKYVKSLI